MNQRPTWPTVAYVRHLLWVYLRTALTFGGIAFLALLALALAGVDL